MIRDFRFSHFDDFYLRISRAYFSLIDWLSYRLTPFSLEGLIFSGFFKVFMSFFTRILKTEDFLAFGSLSFDYYCIFDSYLFYYSFFIILFFSFGVYYLSLF